MPFRTAVLNAAAASTEAALAHTVCDGVDAPTTALARIWLDDQSKELRLVASCGRPIGGGSYHQINGMMSVVRRGESGKIARIASTGEALIVRGLRGDEPWLVNPAWIARQGIRSFVGLPIAIDREVVGVMALFDRSLTSDETIESLRFLLALVAVRLRHFRDSAATSIQRVPVRVADSVSSAEGIVTRPELRALEKRSIEVALQTSKGKIFGPDGAAALLAMKPTTLASRMKALGIT